MSPLLTRPAFARGVGHQERALRRPLARALGALARASGPALLRELVRSGHRIPRAAEQLRLRGILEAHKAELQDALLRIRLPVREQAGEDVPATAARIAAWRIGELIRQIELQQLNTIRWQLEQLFERGPTDALIERIGRTAGLTQQMAAYVQKVTDQAIAAGASEAAAARQGEALAGELMRRRGKLIARTEAVDFTNQVVEERGRILGTGTVKQSVSARDTNVCPICRKNEQAGPIPMNASFPSGHQRPTYHPGCRCLLEVEAA